MKNEYFVIIKSGQFYLKLMHEKNFKSGSIEN